MPVEECATPPLVAALYPFAREVVASISARGRHGPAYRKPFNFLAATKKSADEAAPTRRPVARLRKPPVQKKLALTILAEPERAKKLASCRTRSERDSRLAILPTRSLALSPTRYLL